MKVNTVLIAVLTFSVVLAGCVGNDDLETDSSEIDTTTIDKESFDLGNKGAISGLIVDDNYRPVQLKEDWGAQGPGDYQDIGFVLILETAQRFETTENGEFTVLPLEPGTYTIRVAADNHEAIDKQVNVVAGEFAEVTVEARRTFSSGGTILSQEHVLFSACYASTVTHAVALAALLPCNGDLSGDSGRFDFNSDFSAIKDDIRGMVTELRTNDDGYHSLTVRIVGDGCPTWCEFGEVNLENERYAHLVLYPYKQFPGPEGGEYLVDGQEGYCLHGRDDDISCEYFAWSPEHRFQSALFTRAPNRQYFDPFCDASKPVRDAYNDNLGGVVIPIGCGSGGIVIGVKAQIVQNVFLYELPEEGIQDYCVLCEDADIPE